MDVARLLDRTLEERVIVFGTPPPDGDDIDLVATPRCAQRLRERLAELGFVAQGYQHARFGADGVDCVELFETGAWALPPAQEEALFARATPIAGLEHLVRPAPEHRLMLAARDLVYGDGSLAEDDRHRIAEALAEEPRAWELGAPAAQAWGVGAALGALRAAWERGEKMTPAQRASALQELIHGTGSAHRAALAWRRALGRPARGALIVLSGVDGSGKSTQAALLAAALTRLGHEPVVRWTRLEGSTLRRGIFDTVAAPLDLVDRLRRRGASRADVPSGHVAVVARRRSLRQRSWVLTQLWVMCIAVLHARAQRRAVGAHVRAGQVVICDRYSLDALVDMRLHYGPGPRFRPQAVLLHRLSPRPTHSYWLDIDPRQSLARKDEGFTERDIADQAELFREHYVAAGAQRLDGARPTGELAAEIGRDVWARLR